MSLPTLTLIIPTLGEAQRLRALLPELSAALGPGDQILVSDGGSQDGTAQVAIAAGVGLVQGNAGRGGQLNRAAAQAQGEVLLFLHADTHLPPGAPDLIREAIRAGADGGAFRLRFDSPRWVFRFGAGWINLRTRLTRAPLGDQAQFVTRAMFEHLGGFPEWPILEDLEFARRLDRAGRLVILPAPVTTSARRFERRGVTRTIATNWLIWALYWLGVSPHRLARLYT